jgi:hypothetical protein
LAGVPALRSGDDQPLATGLFAYSNYRALAEVFRAALKDALQDEANLQAAALSRLLEVAARDGGWTIWDSSRAGDFLRAKWEWREGAPLRLAEELARYLTTPPHPTVRDQF